MDFILTLEWIAFGCSLFLLHPSQPKYLRLVTLSLAIIVVAESLGYYYRIHLKQSNHSIYNISVPLVILLLLELIRQALQLKSQKLLVGVFMGAYITFALGNILFIQGTEKFANYNYIFGAILLAISSSIYLVQFIKEPQIISIWKHPMFWIVWAILLLYVPKSILFVFFEYFTYNPEYMGSFGAIFRQIGFLLNLVYFSMISYASLCRLIYLY